MSLTIENMKAEMMEKHLTKVAFTATFSDDKGKESMDLEINGGFKPPADAEAGYTDDELLAMCWELVKRMNLETHLNSLLLARKTPVLVLPRVDEVSQP